MFHSLRQVGYTMLAGGGLFYLFALLPVSGLGDRDITVRCPACQEDQSIPPGYSHFTCRRCGDSGLTVANIAPPDLFN